jgi:hypothetical protein
VESKEQHIQIPTGQVKTIVPFLKLLINYSKAIIEEEPELIQKMRNKLIQIILRTFATLIAVE